MSEAVIECRGLTKVYKDFWLRPRVAALDNLDLEIQPKEVFGLLGPNGAGKSTTIKLLLGLLFPTRGVVSVFGKRPTEVSVKARIGYLPEESYLYRFLNARETLDYFGRLFQLERRERNRRIEMLLDMVGLSGAQNRPVGEYSKGMQRRIGLAQALINDPELLILDEPTTGLDPIGSRQIKDLILHLRTRGKTILLCSHLLSDVEDVCDRATILYGGKVRAIGKVGDLLADEGGTVIETPRLKPATIEKIRALIAQEEQGDIRKVESPRKKLEALFLEIVEKAQAEGADTSGARSGGAVAQFLGTSPAAVSEEAKAGVLISELVAPPVQPAPAPIVDAAPLVVPVAESSVLAELQKVETPNVAQKPAVQPVRPAGPPKPVVEKEVNRDLIDGLLGDSSKKDS